MDTNEETSVNLAVVAGTCSSPADVRVLPSEEVLAQLQVTTRIDGRAVSVPVAVPAALPPLSSSSADMPAAASQPVTPDNSGLYPQ